MNKAEFIKCVATKTKQPMTHVDETLSAIIDCITKTIAKNDKITLPGFGTFSMKKRAARTGRNPQTGKPLKIAAKKVPHFSAGKTLKEKVNK